MRFFRRVWNWLARASWFVPGSFDLPMIADESAPEIPDPLEEEFRALEDAVLKRDDPAAWMAKRGYPGLMLGSPYGSLQNLYQNAYASAQMQYQNDAHDNLLRAMQAQQMQNMAAQQANRGFLAGAIGGALGGLLGPNKPQ